MRAVRLHEYGGVDQLKMEDIPQPRPQAGEVLVRIYSSTVNPIDWRIRSGSVQARLPVTLPLTLGCDFAGAVEECGAGVTQFKPGDEVFGYCGAGRDGSYAEYIALPAAHVALRPSSLSRDEAAALALGALTAYIAMFEHGKLSKGQSILIHAAAGGVGMMAVQLAKAAGAKVYATGSAASIPLIRSFGPDVIIDYKTQRFEDIAKNMDVVLDTVGGETQTRSWECLRKGGFLACVVNPPDPELIEKYGCGAVRSAARPDGALLAQFAKLAEEGKLRVTIDRVLPLDEIAQAHRLSEAGHTHGKIVLRV